MDFTAIGNKIFRELRLLRRQLQQLAGAIHDSKEADKNQDQPQPKVLVDVSFTDEVVREKRTTEEQKAD